MKNDNPFLYSFLREAAIWRHAALAYGTYGVNDKGHCEMFEHMKVIDKIYGKVQR